MLSTLVCIALKKLQSSINPTGCQVIGKTVHHLLGMVGSGCQSQLLFSTSHSWVVDGLYIVTILLDQVVGQLGTEGRVADL